MEGAGNKSTSITDDDTEQVRDVILQNRRVIVDEVAHQLQLSHGATYEIIQNRLAFLKVCVRWDPKQPKELHKEKRLDMCKRLLDRYGAECYFLKRIVMGDETWIYH